VLEVFNMTKEQFLDFCIMCGTDYNKNIFRVGPSKAYKLLLEHKSIEGIGQNTVLDISVLNHVRGRELFREYEKSDVAVPYCGFPDFTELQMLLIKKNARMNIDSLKSTFTCQLLVFDEDDDIVEDEQE